MEASLVLTAQDTGFVRWPEQRWHGYDRHRDDYCDQAQVVTRFDSDQAFRREDALGPSRRTDHLTPRRRPNTFLDIKLEINAEFLSGASDQIKRAFPPENASSLGFKTKVWD